MAVQNISSLLKATMAAHNQHVAAQNMMNSGRAMQNTGVDPLQIYNNDRRTSSSLRQDFYGDISPYVSAAQVAQKQADQFNAEQAALDRDWQERMSSTAHQREVADLKAAGLNPVLSAGGQGAATGSGASASSTNALTGVLGNMAMSAMNAVSSLAQTTLNNSQQRLSAYQTNRTNTNIAKMNNQTQKEITQISGQYHLKSSEVSAFATQYAAQLSQAASMYSANMSYKTVMDSNPVQKAIAQAQDEFNINASTAKNFVSDLISKVGNMFQEGFVQQAF